jgi:large conductance mechanosensitive channel
MWTEFKAFLLKQNILALALAVVIGEATNKLVQAVVNDFVMPIVSLALPDPSTSQKSVFHIGKASLAWGDFVSVLINFVVIGLVCWRITKALIKEPKTAAKPATKECRYCYQVIDARASRCPDCTSQLASAAA